jgi:poly(hydroxyalkanoate) depolymerase family esterase
MNARLSIDMMNATRLTREGRLADAVAVLRGALQGADSSAAPVDRDGGVQQEQAGRAWTVLDMVPPSTATGPAWTSPEGSETLRSWRPAGMSGLRTPEALRAVLGRMGGAVPGCDRVTDPSAWRAPAPLPDGARFEQRTYTNAAGSRAYKLYIPSGCTNRALPLVVMLHGCTQSPDDFAAGTRMNDLAEEMSFLVAYPAQTQAANASKCWNWFSAGDQQRDQGEPSLIAGITRQIISDFPVDPRRVYVAGLSAGGAAAAIMGSTYPDLYAAIGVHSGLACGAASDLPSAFAAMRQGGARRQGRSAVAVPTIVFHGDRDTTVNPVNADQVINQSKAETNLRASVSRGEAPGGISYTRTVQTDESGRPMLEQWVLHGAGHAWSGGSAAGSYTEPRGPDASREMMRFFLQHPAGDVSLC